jgi:hypothetical protein
MRGSCGIVRRGIRPDPMDRFCLTYRTSHLTTVPHLLPKFHGQRLKEIKTQPSTATYTCIVRLLIAWRISNCLRKRLKRSKLEDSTYTMTHDMKASVRRLVSARGTELLSYGTAATSAWTSQSEVRHPVLNVLWRRNFTLSLEAPNFWTWSPNKIVRLNSWCSILGH